MKRLLILVILCGMLCAGCSGKFVRTEYIKQTIPPLPAKPEYYSFQVDENYCMDERNAKNLLKNKALIDGYVEQLEQMIEGLR